MQFSNRKSLGYLRVLIEHNLYKIVRDIKLCTNFKIYQIRVPLVFFPGTGSFGTQARMLNR